ncbi:hypothetical protein B484DRAFT_451873 [Ochromonadaceae sp. CCMP2298]|nr:hypothetical protein B484DRAFT_451873 [Ochromonadaceae sp. CCMP2298]
MSDPAAEERAAEQAYELMMVLFVFFMITVCLCCVCRVGGYCTTTRHDAPRPRVVSLLHTHTPPSTTVHNNIYGIPPTRHPHHPNYHNIDSQVQMQTRVPEAHAELYGGDEGGGGGGGYNPMWPPSASSASAPPAYYASK